MKNLKKKLVLKKHTVASLDGKQLKKLYGGCSAGRTIIGLIPTLKPPFTRNTLISC